MALELVSWVDFRCVLHHFSSQVWPENGPKPTDTLIYIFSFLRRPLVSLAPIGTVQFCGCRPMCCNAGKTQRGIHLLILTVLRCRRGPRSEGPLQHNFHKRTTPHYNYTDPPKGFVQSDLAGARARFGLSQICASRGVCVVSCCRICGRSTKI